MNDSINKFMSNMSNLNERDYMFNLITCGIAPTICGYKTSTLITLSHKYKNSYNLWKDYRNEFLSKVPLKYFELNNAEDTVTVLFYNENDLESKIIQKDYMNFLEDLGYEKNGNLLSCLYRLREKYREGCPHEIGLFLDIPLQDVLGFMKNLGKNFLCCGYWKVYNDLEGALNTFEKYNWSKKRAMELIGQGKEVFEVIDILNKYRIACTSLSCMKS
jgi:hypothetical protein